MSAGSVLTEIIKVLWECDCGTFIRYHIKGDILLDEVHFKCDECGKTATKKKIMQCNCGALFLPRKSFVHPLKSCEYCGNSELHAQEYKIKAQESFKGENKIYDAYMDLFEEYHRLLRQGDMYTGPLPRTFYFC